MAFADEVDALAAAVGAQRRRDQWLRKIESYRATAQAYRQCFMDDQGNLTDAGKAVLANIAALAGVGKARVGRSTEEIQFGEGQRHIALHIINAMHLDSERLARMARKLRENRDDE